MKKIHKKIGAGVLVAGVLLGSGGFSGSSVAHASDYSNISNIFLLNIEKEKQSVIEKIYSLGENVDIISVSKKGQSKKLYSESVNISKSCCNIKKEISEKLKNLSDEDPVIIIKLSFEDLDLEILIGVSRDLLSEDLS